MQAFLAQILIVAIWVVTTTPVQASRKSYGPERGMIRVRQVQQIQQRAAEEKRKFMSALDAAIAKLESRKHNEQKLIQNMEAAVNREYAKTSIRIHTLLNDRNKFTLAFNDAVALNPELTQFEFKRSLLALVNQKNKLEGIKRVKRRLQKSGSIANFLKDYKQAIENNDLDRFSMKSKSQGSPSRSIAYYEHFEGESALILAAAFAVGSLVSILIGVALGGSLVTVVGVTFIIGGFVILAGIVIAAIACGTSLLHRCWW